MYPLALFVESSGKYLYVQTNLGLSIDSIDQSSGALTQLNGPLAAFAFGAGTVAADPMQGASVAAKTVQVTNSGTSALHVSAVTLSGSNPGDFSQSNTCAANPVAVPGSCSITVNFTPQSEGQRSASVVVTDDAANSPQSIALNGDIVSPFQLTAAAAGSTSTTVTAGATAQYSLLLTPGPGYSGNVAFSCSVAPGTIVVSNGNAVLFQVTVTTSGNGFVVPPEIFAPRILIRSESVVWLIIAWILVLAALLKIRRERRMVPQFVLVAALLGTLSIGAAGCGGSTAAPTADQPDPIKIFTPSGTTMITVTAKSGSLTPQSIQLTLTVN